ncbi:molybdenum cofactor guanylyltransferase [bacterium]|nr:molybdenum cofactor guanylyltransferase [bacterium]
MRIFGVILAGGAARRMGADKALVPLAGRPLIAWVAERLGPQVEALAISANGDPARFANLGLPVLPDAESRGPLSGILAALHWAAPLGATAVVSAPCDGPFLPPDLVPRLCLAGEAGGAAFATSGADQHPTCGLWPVTLTAALQDFLASGAVPRLRDFALQHGAGLADFPPDSFVNANSPADLARLEARLGGGPDAV